MKITIAECRKATQVYYRIRKDEIMGPSLVRRICGPRHVAMALAWEMTDSSSTAIARYFGKKDHSSVFDAVDRVTAREHQRTAYESMRLSLAVYALQRDGFARAEGAR